MMCIMKNVKFPRDNKFTICERERRVGRYVGMGGNVTLRRLSYLTMGVVLSFPSNTSQKKKNGNNNKSGCVTLRVLNAFFFVCRLSDR